MFVEQLQNDYGIIMERSCNDHGYIIEFFWYNDEKIMDNPGMIMKQLLSGYVMIMEQLWEDDFVNKIHLLIRRIKST